jgi:hypothetical protein
VYNTYANQNNTYPFNPHVSSSHPTPLFQLPPPSSSSALPPFAPSFSPFSNNPHTNNNFNTINQNNIEYAFKKLKEYSSDGGGGDKSDGSGGKSESGAAGGAGDVDVDTLNPNIYSISINDGPAEPIHVGTRRRFASAWPYKELMDVDTNSNANSEPNSNSTSANTSFTNFFELSVPSVHEFVRKSFRNFHPRRKTFDEEYVLPRFHNY